MDGGEYTDYVLDSAWTVVRCSKGEPTAMREDEAHRGFLGFLASWTGISVKGDGAVAMGMREPFIQSIATHVEGAETRIVFG